MVKYSIRDISIKFTEACKLKYRPLCIYGSEKIPENAIRSTKLHFCISNAMVSLAFQKNINTLFFGIDEKRGTCPGSRAWLGYEGFNPFLKYFLSTGIKKYPAENLVANPELAEDRLKSIGKITPLGKYTIIRACEDVYEDDIDIKAIIIFGNAEQIRNLCMLAFFKSKTSFNAIQMPWGSSCASFITYPAGLAENGPKECVLLGPMDPTDNYFFPPDLLSIGIPIKIALQMCEDLENSFIIKRRSVAFPQKRANPAELFTKKDFKEFSEQLFKNH
ncbi:MAG: DUF169 domain-containing protein [Promethearchaeota archaeon]